MSSTRDRDRRPRSPQRTNRPSGRSGSQRVQSRSLNGVGSHDTGYTLHHPNYSGRSGQQVRRLRMRGKRSPRSLALLIVIACIALLAIFGISSCVSSCVATRNAQKEEQEAAETNSIDSRVAYGADDTISQELSGALDNADKLKDIAANATAYSDDRIIELALREPTAIDFVQQLPTASKETSAYTGTVVKGTYPELYDWDTNWAFMDYGTLPLGMTGSGPTSLAMAYMGLTGKNDKSPADMAQLALDGGYATGASGTSADFFTSVASSLGLKCTKLENATENDIAENLTASTPILVELQAGTVGDESHWALLISYNRDTSVTLYDPTSTSASAHSWDAGTIADSATTLYVLEAEDSTSSTSSTASTTTTTSNQ
ncbi:MAG: C39 family peptidase [Atopobiaceae bacterium]